MLMVLAGKMGRLDFPHVGHETVLAVGRVVDHPDGTVGLHEAVRPLDVTVAVARFVVALDVVGVQVLDAVLEAVRGGRVVFETAIVTVAVFEAFVLGRREGHRHGCEQRGGERDRRRL